MVSLQNKVQQVQAFEVVSSRTNDLMACSTLSSVNRDWYTTASNCVQTKGGISENSSDFAYGSMNYASPSTQHYKKACSRNSRK